MRRSSIIILCSILICSTALLGAQSSDAKPQSKKKKDDKKQSAPAEKAASATSAKKTKTEPKPERKLTERERAIHALNRLTFGPRPGDVDRILSIGVDKWIEQQLAPATEPDATLDAKLAPWRTLRMQPLEMLTTFPNGNMIRQVADKKKPYPTDTVLAGLYEVLIAKQRDQDALNAANNLAANNANVINANTSAPKPSIVVMEDKPAPNRNMNGRSRADNSAGAANSTNESGMEVKPMNGTYVLPNAMPMSDEDQKKAVDAKKRAQEDQLAREVADKILTLPREQRMIALMTMPLYDRRIFFSNLNGPQRDRFLNESSAADKETFFAVNYPTGVVVSELQQGKLTRAIYAQRQLEEVMTDFWFNHFNVYLNKDIDQYLVTSYERDAIRANALGKFRDLLFATAKHPAMLYYLDQFQSVGPDSQQAQQRKGNNGNGGLNENYAREVMELHTLGVDGGYTQDDVTELARILTGWGIAPPEKGSAYEFHPRAHQPGTKHLLGQIFYENGEQEGVQALEMLAKHPATAQFICKKLAMRFVSDDPPEELVERMARTFTSTDGDIREVLHTMFTAHEFWSPSTLRAKTKTPLEFVVSAVRATGADVQNVQPLTQQLQRMGMPLYQMQPPTGYKMVASAWMNSDALIDRLNFSLGFVANKINGTRFDAGRTLALGILTRPENGSVEGGMNGLLELLQTSLISGVVSETTRDTIKKQLMDPDVAGKVYDDPTKAISVAAGLLLGSPEFQKR